MGFNESGFFVDFNLVPSTPEFPQKGLGDAFGLASGFFYGASMFFNGYRKDATPRLVVCGTSSSPSWALVLSPSS